MNWSEYSRFVADVFGAPLALEGPSRSSRIHLHRTVDFGWSGCPAKCISRASGSPRSVSTPRRNFIIAANSWMQHPVGVAWDDERGRPAMNDFFAVLTNNTTLGRSRTSSRVPGSAATFVAGIGCWWMARNSWRAAKLRAGQEVPDSVSPSHVGATADQLDDDARKSWRPVTRFALVDDDGRRRP